MSKLIVEMEMPKCCYECPLLDEIGDYPMCRATQETRGYNFDTLNKKMDKCPIKGVLPDEHGDLIDRNHLIERCQRQQKDDWNQTAAPYSWAYAYEQFEEDVLNQHAVIAAERKDDGTTAD